MFKVKLTRFHLLRSGDVAINRSGPKPRQHVLIHGMVCRHGEGASNTVQSHTKEVRVAMQSEARKSQHTQTIILACDTCFIYYFKRKARLCDGNHISYIGVYSLMSFSIGRSPTNASLVVRSYLHLPLLVLPLTDIIMRRLAFYNQQNTIFFFLKIRI